MTSSLAQRVFLAHLELSYRLGRRVPLAEFGELVATEMGRAAPFTAAAVSRWERGIQVPSPLVIEAIASLAGMDPGWLSHGEKTAAPAPRLASPPPGIATRSPSPAVEAASPAEERERQPERIRSRGSAPDRRRP